MYKSFLYRTSQNRKLYALKIGRSALGNSTRAVWIDGGIHARYTTTTRKSVCRSRDLFFKIPIVHIGSG